MYCYRIKKYIGAYYAILGQVDALVFTAGIGENSSSIRKHACVGLDGLGISIDDNKNEGQATSAFEIQSDAAALKVLVIPTNEEMEIAQQAASCIQAPD
jgi:acetate kinase